MNSKNKTHRSEAYLNFIRSKGCYITGEDVNVIAHHVRMFGGGGIGLKPPDYLCLPLTPEKHHKLHSQGEKSFFEENRIDAAGAIIDLQISYLYSKCSKEKIIFILGEAIKSFEDEENKK